MWLTPHLQSSAVVDVYSVTLKKLSRAKESPERTDEPEF